MLRHRLWRSSFLRPVRAWQPGECRNGHALVALVASGSGGVEERAIQQSGNFSRRDGLAEQVALPLRTSVGLETCELGCVFDALGRGRQAQSLRQSEDGADDDQTLITLVEMRHEAPVDLDLVEVK